MKLGMVVFSNDSGLGAQTRRLVQFLTPDRLLIINSGCFSKNKQHHDEWYEGYPSIVSEGFPRSTQIIKFLEGLTHVFTCEDPYSDFLIGACRLFGIKLICQVNYELSRNVGSPDVPVPDTFLMPSHWKMEEMQGLFGESRVKYLPPPIDPKEFEEVRSVNFTRDQRWRLKLLHVVGTLAFMDRNGTLDLLASLPFIKSNFELVIRSQHVLPEKYLTKDPRVRYEIGNMERNCDLYRDFDGMVLPRRYGGLSLTTNEALMSGLPVLMPDISPNNKILPSEWLVEGKVIRTVKTKAEIDLYATRVKLMAAKIDSWFESHPGKQEAFAIGEQNFSPDVLRSKYDSLWQ